MNVKMLCSLFILLFIGVGSLRGQVPANQMPPEPKQAKGQPTLADVIKEQAADVAQEQDEKKRQEVEAKSKGAKNNQAEEKRKAAFETGEGIDTLELEGGNWLLKRQALEKTIDALEKINKLFTAIIEQRLTFLATRNKVDHDLDLFILELGIETGDLSQLLSSLQESLEQERKKQGDLTEQERQALETVEKELEEVKNLQGELKTLANLDDALDDVIMQVEKEISKSNAYQMQGWKNFQTIKKVLSDEKAEELYLQTDGLYKNLQDIQHYLSGELLSYFNATVAKINASMKKVKNEFDTLNNLGLDLKKKIEEYTQVSEEIEKKELVEQIVQEEQKQPVKKGWFADFWNSLKNAIARFWDNIFNLFSTKTTATKPPEEPTNVAPEKPAEEASNVQPVTEKE